MASLVFALMAAVAAGAADPAAPVDNVGFLEPQGGQSAQVGASPAQMGWRFQLEGDRAWLVDGQGGRVAPVDPVIRVRRRGGPGERVVARRWRADGSSLVTTAVTSTASWALRLEGLALTATLRHRRSARLERAAVELYLPGPALAVDRAWRDVAPPVLADRFSPQVARVGRVTVIAKALAFETALARGGARLSMALDDERAHPLRLLSDCVGDRRERPAETDVSQAPSVVGAEATARLSFVPGGERVPLPLRFPRGFRAAVVFTDHADQSSAARLGALMYGRAGPDSPLAHRGGDRGFANRGLSMTKSVFPLFAPGYPHQVDDERYRALLDALAGGGIEIGVHSVSGGRDRGRRLAAGLAAAAHFQPRTWIDHQPNTNCEAITNRGAREGPWNVVRSLEASGYRYAWAGDVRLPRGSINLFKPDRRQSLPSTLFQHPLVGGLWLFHSSWRGLSRKAFLKRYSKPSLDRLVEERGLHVAHSYLDLYQPGQSRKADWTLLRRVPGGGYELLPEADALFGALQDRQERGELWVASLGAVADHLVAVSSMDWRVDGTALIVRSELPIAGLSVLFPDGHVRVVDVPAHQPVRVEP